MHRRTPPARRGTHGSARNRRGTASCRPWPPPPTPPPGRGSTATLDDAPAGARRPAAARHRPRLRRRRRRVPARRRRGVRDADPDGRRRDARDAGAARRPPRRTARGCSRPAGRWPRSASRARPAPSPSAPSRRARTDRRRASRRPGLHAGRGRREGAGGARRPPDRPADAVPGRPEPPDRGLLRGARHRDRDARQLQARRRPGHEPRHRRLPDRGRPRARRPPRRRGALHLLHRPAHAARGRAARGGCSAGRS